MLIICNDIFNLPCLDKIKLVAGSNGLNRVIRWVHVMEHPQYFKWVKGGELLLTTGVAMKDDPEALAQFIRDINSRNISGLVINVGPYIEKTPKEVIELADSLNFPIFELPFEVGLIDVSQSICNAIFSRKLEQESKDSFMKDILFGNLSITDETINKAIYYGYVPKKNYYSIIVKISRDNLLSVEAIMLIKQHMDQILSEVMHKWDKNTININLSNSQVILIPINEKENSLNILNTISENIIDALKIKDNNVELNIGIGTDCKEFKDFKKSISNAQKALSFFEFSNTHSKYNISDYRKMGLYRLFFEMDNHQELTALYEETLGKLIEYDSKNSTNLINTLEAYLDENANLIKTSEELFIHPNTLKYRIHRIEEILNCDIRNINKLLEFSMAMKIGRFLKSTN